MYTPRSYAEPDPAVVLDFIAAHPLGALVTASDEGLFATHIPWLVDRTRGAHGVLQGHLARANPHHRRPSLTAEALVVFQGPDAYVHPGWYPAKQEHGRVVPTWNYVAVHAYGTLRWIDDEAFLHAQVRALTDAHEHGRAHAWAVDDAPADYLAQQVRAIVGVELEITRLEGKWKMSQNRAAADVEGVVRGLGTSPDEVDRTVSRIVEERSARQRP